jgi:hypothetical protein
MASPGGLARDEIALGGQAGSFHAAVTLGEELLAETDLSPRMRQRVEE